MKEASITVYVCDLGHRHLKESAARICDIRERGRHAPDGFLTAQEARNLFWEQDITCCNADITGFARLGLFKSMNRGDKSNQLLYVERRGVEAAIERLKIARSQQARDLTHEFPVEKTRGIIPRTYRESASERRLREAEAVGESADHAVEIEAEPEWLRDQTFGLS